MCKVFTYCVKKKISKEEIDECEYKLLKFVGESQTNYEIKFMTFNVHALTHYSLSAKMCGPLWCSSAFPFENGIFQLMKEINAPNGCVKQIARKWLINCQFQNFLANDETNSVTVKYCKNLFSQRQPLQQCAVVDDIVLIGPGNVNTRVKNLVRALYKKDTAETKVFDHCIYKSWFLHSNKYQRALRTNDSVIQTLGKILI